MVGAGLGGTDPLAPIPAWSGQHRELAFRTIKSTGDLDREVAQAQGKGQAVMLDFYADWCVSCKEMEKYTFTDPAVQATLKDVVLLRANVTANDTDDQALLKRFGIYGPPTIAFYGVDGHERAPYRVVGFMKAPQFAALSAKAVGSATIRPARAPRATAARRRPRDAGWRAAVSPSCWSPAPGRRAF